MITFSQKQLKIIEEELDRAREQLKYGINLLLAAMPESLDLHKDYPKLMVESLLRDVERKMRKFCRGHIEHGGDIRTRDLSIEIQGELDDLFWYNEAEYKWKKK